MKIREHGVSEAEADGRDEGGFFKLVEVPELSFELQERMKRCGGCYYEFYNHRVNCCGPHCWSLTNDANFRGRGRPTCWIAR